MATKKTTTQPGALGKKPSFMLGTTADELRKQRADLDAQIRKGGSNASQLQAQRKQVQNALTKANQSSTTQGGQSVVSTPPQNEQNYNQMLDNASVASNKVFNQINEQQPFNPQTIGIDGFRNEAMPIQQFNPGDFQNQYNTAYGNVLNEFNRTNADTFKQQEQDFNQYAAERGWDPTSEVAQKLYKQRVSDPQTNARQAAMNAAHDAGLSAQNQAYGQNLSTYGQNLAAQGQQYGQGLSTYGQNLAAQGQQFGQATTQYQMPYQNLGAFAPYANLQAQGAQNQFTAGQNELDRQQQSNLAQQQFGYQKYLQAHQKSGGGGGGGGDLSLADRMALQNNEFYNYLALLGASGGSQPANQTANAGIAGASQGAAGAVLNYALKG